MINGALVAQLKAGYVPQNTTPRRLTLSGTYFPMSTGYYTLELYNYRNGIKTSLYNFIDNFTVTPQNSNFSVSTANISIASGGSVDLQLAAGASNAGKDYFVLMSAGNHPGFTLSSVHVPLNIDAFFGFSRTLANGSIFQNTRGKLDSSGQATARFNMPGPVNPTHLGKSYTFAYVLTQNPGAPPLTFASVPVLINFIP